MLAKNIAASRTTRFALLSSHMEAKDLGLSEPDNKLIYEQLTMNDLVHFAKKNISNKPYRYIILGDEKQLDMQPPE